MRTNWIHPELEGSLPYPYSQLLDFDDNPSWDLKRNLWKAEGEWYKVITRYQVRKEIPMNRWLVVIVFLFCLFLPACVHMTGTPSLTVLSDDSKLEGTVYRPTGERIEETENWHWVAVLVFWGRSDPNHEALIARVLEKYNADVLLDAELKQTLVLVPYIFTLEKVTVKGRPAVVAKGE